MAKPCDHMNVSRGSAGWGCHDCGKTVAFLSDFDEPKKPARTPAPSHPGAQGKNALREALERAEIITRKLDDSGWQYGAELCFRWTVPWVQGVGHLGVEQTDRDAETVKAALAASASDAGGGKEAS